MGKLDWFTWLGAYGPKQLAEDLGIDVKTSQRWLNRRELPKDKFKRLIIDIAGGVLDYNSFFEV